MTESIEYSGKENFKEQLKNPVFTIYLEDHTDGYVLGIVNSSKYPAKEKHWTDENVSYHAFTVPKNYLYPHKKYFSVRQNKFYVSLGNSLRCIEENRITEERNFAESIISLFVDQSNNLWISLNNKGLYMHPDFDLNAVPEHYLAGQTVSKIIQDDAGSYWFSTTENGVYFVPSFNFRNYSSHNLKNLDSEIIYSMALKGDKLFFSTENRKMYSLIVDDGIPKNVKEFKLDGYVDSNINDILVASDGSLWVSCTIYLNFADNGKMLLILIN